jgi:hypothetical protein
MINGYNLLWLLIWSDYILTGKNILKTYVKNETNKLYVQGIDELIKKDLKLVLLNVTAVKGY